jgi:hypothetical protein
VAHPDTLVSGLQRTVVLVGPQVAARPRSVPQLPQLVPVKPWQSASDEHPGTQILVVAFQTTQ